MRLLVNFQQNKIHYRNYLWLLVICLLAYWPLTFGVFSVKNDAIHYFLPYRFSISEAIRNGEWPFWSPYIYLGNPVYGDMQSGAWNPIVWFFSLIGRYDITLFHYENLLYIFLGGVGMYKLTHRLVQNQQTSFLIAASYMLSGFMLSGQLINWLAAAAFFPFVIHYYLKTLSSNSYGDSIKSGVALFFLFTAGYPSFFITTIYILLFLFFLKLTDQLRNKGELKKSWKIFSFQHLLIILIFAGLSLPAIISYIDLLPYYQRGSGTTYANAVHNSFEWQHLVSFVFPSSIKANDIISSTDVTCRNVYLGIFSLIILSAAPPKLNRRNILLLLLALFAFLFSLGDATPIRKICYSFLPLMDSFRHPSQMRLFFIIAVLLLVAPGLKAMMENKIPVQRIRSVTWLASGTILTITVLAALDSDILSQFSGLGLSQTGDKFKNLIENISFADTVFVNGLIQLAFILLFLLWIIKYPGRKKGFFFLWLANLIIMAQLVLPLTFVGQTAAKEINTIIHTSPKGFPADGLEKTIGENSKDATDHFDKIALTFFYNKKIGLSRISYSPSFLDEQHQLFGGNAVYNYILSKPAVYLSDSILQLKDTALLINASDCSYFIAESPISINGNCLADKNASVKKMSANHFEISAQTNTACFLVLTQSYHHYWEAWLDGKKEKIYKVNTAFMGIPLTTGNHTIIFRFVPANTIKATRVMVAAMALLLIATLVSLYKKRRS
ncbi:MAG: YfhO family protein [Sphingobacteriales bacterium]|nr:YfhO family protein [Sphingobacteriales bacterium]